MKKFKTNVLNNFIHYMKLTRSLSVGKYIDDKKSEIDKDLAVGVDALIHMGKSSFWGLYGRSRIMFWRRPKDIRNE